MYTHPASNTLGLSQLQLAGRTRKRPRDGLVRQRDSAQHAVHEHDDRRLARRRDPERGQLLVRVSLSRFFLFFFYSFKSEPLFLGLGGCFNPDTKWCVYLFPSPFSPVLSLNSD